jgi:hypothetical protein
MNPLDLYDRLEGEPPPTFLEATYETTSTLPSLNVAVDFNDLLADPNWSDVSHTTNVNELKAWLTPVQV